MKLKSLKKSEVAEEIKELLSERELKDLTLFMDKKRESGIKGDK